MAWIPSPVSVLRIIQRIEEGENVLEDVGDLFLTFLRQSYSPDQFSELMQGLNKTFDGRFAHYFEFEPEIAQVLDLAMRDSDAAVRLVVKRLQGLESLLSAPYEPDGYEDKLTLGAAIHYQATLLVRAMRLCAGEGQEFGYGDDVSLAHHELERLLERYGDIDKYVDNCSETLLWIRSISDRVAAELAFQGGGYTRALVRTVSSIEAFARSDKFDDCLSRAQVDDDCLPSWLNRAEERLSEYLERLHESPADRVDWQAVVAACKTLKVYFPGNGDMAVSILAGAYDSMGYWDEQLGWAQAQLTPDQLRDVYGRQEDELAAQRVEKYFFPGGLWMKLPERAQQAVVDADRKFMASTRGRYVGIANDIRIATEEVLYSYLWLPLSRTQPLSHPGLKMILDKPKQDRRSPSIDDYVQLLWHRGVKDYFQGLGMSDGDVKFLTDDNRTTKHLQALQRTRNSAEHEPGDTVDPQTIRQLYAESLGIGRRGVLPELVRLLAKA